AHWASARTPWLSRVWNPDRPGAGCTHQVPGLHKKMTPARVLCRAVQSERSLAFAYGSPFAHAMLVFLECRLKSLAGPGRFQKGLHKKIPILIVQCPTRVKLYGPNSSLISVLYDEIGNRHALQAGRALNPPLLLRQQTSLSPFRA